MASLSVIPLRCLSMVNICAADNLKLYTMSNSFNAHA